MKQALVYIKADATLAAHLAAAGADIVSTAPDSVCVHLELSPDGWGIIDSLTALESRVAKRIGITDLLLDARVLSEVKP